MLLSSREKSTSMSKISAGKMGASDWSFDCDMILVQRKCVEIAWMIVLQSVRRPVKLESLRLEGTSEALRMEGRWTMTVLGRGGARRKESNMHKSVLVRLDRATLQVEF